LPTQNAEVRSEKLNTHCNIYWDVPYGITSTSIKTRSSKKKEEERLFCAAVLRGPTPIWFQCYHTACNK